MTLVLVRGVRSHFAGSWASGIHELFAGSMLFPYQSNIEQYRKTGLCGLTATCRGPWVPLGLQGDSMPQHPEMQFVPKYL